MSQVEKNLETDFSSSNRILYRHRQGRRLVVVPEQLAESIIRKYYEDNGHFGREKLEKLIKHEFNIDHLSKKVKTYISNCIVCLVSEKKRGKKEGYLHPIPKDDKPLQTYNLDHLGPMTAADKQYRYIFGVIASFSKFCWLYAQVLLKL